MYCLLAHATHVLQPCDVSLFGPLKTTWKAEVKNWQMDNLGEPMTKKAFPLVYKRAYMRSATMVDAVSGFNKCSLYPFQPSKIDGTKLGPSSAFSATKTPLLTTQVGTATFISPAVMKTPLLHVAISDHQAATAHSACVPVATATQPTRLTVPYRTSPAVNTDRLGMSGASLALSTTNTPLLPVTTSDDQAATAHSALVPVATATQPTRLTVPYSTSPAVNSHRWGMSGASLAFSTPTHHCCLWPLQMTKLLQHTLHASL